MILVYREATTIGLNFLEETLHHPNAMGIDSRCGQADNLVKAVAIFDASALKRQKTQVDVNRDAQYGSNTIHGIAHTPGTCSACQHKHASAADDG